jgi:hypothetical protein
MRQTRRDGDRERDSGTVLRRVARSHRVRVGWLRLVSTGTLADPEFVKAIRTAAKDPALWPLVNPAVRTEQLTIPELKIKRLGGSRDDLLAAILDNLETLSHPSNRNFAQQTSALQLVTEEIDRRLEDLMRAEAERGRAAERNIEEARAKRTETADERAAEYVMLENEYVTSGKAKTKAHAHLLIAQKKNLKTSTPIKQAIYRLKKKQNVTL